MLWPYRSERIEAVVSDNRTGCAVDVLNYSGWTNEVIVPGIWASRVNYPLDLIAVVEACPGLPDRQPHAAELRSTLSGKTMALGQSCADHSDDAPCSLELPALGTLEGQDRYDLFIVRRAGAKPRTARVQVTVKREWRSIAWDALLSV